MDVKIPDLYAPLFNNNNGVVKYPNDVLRKIAEPVGTNEDVSKIITQMSDILGKTTGIGLAAPQIGISKRIIMIRHNKRYALINPVIEDASGVFTADEGCMSIPNLWGHVVRHQSITLRGTSPHGKEVVLKLTDMEAVVPQHEIDHLDGVLFIDKTIPKSLNWFAKQIGLPISAEFEDILKNEKGEDTKS